MSRGRGPAEGSSPSVEGLLVVDKPAGWTSHDVVARLRRAAATRRVGHAGTLDPMATGVLLVGIGRATRLLGHLALTDKAYLGTIRLGLTTTTDDAEGEPAGGAPAGAVTDARITAGLEALTGAINQVPSSVSAIKVDGVRSYVRVRAGEPVALPSRPVVVTRLDLLGVRRGGDVVDLEVSVECSSGTYVRALARDLGAGLGVGGHLTALRRTRVGQYGIQSASTLDELTAEGFRLADRVVSLAAAAAAAFARREVDAETARLVSHGSRLPPTGRLGPVAIFGPEGELLSLVEDRDGAARPLVVFASS
ncbi:MAG: tRNA pseudouridine(55) synthase TruB [Actinomycetota bacterium]|nr:tRNA pseudouridine(55) synthase TruB [Actinomycetota bacterium]